MSSRFPDAYVDFPDTMPKKQAGLYSRKTKPAALAVDAVDDNYAYIESLLDTLQQSDDGPEADSAPLTPHESSSGALDSLGESDFPSLSMPGSEDVHNLHNEESESALQAEARPAANAGAVHADSEAWNSLLQKFCQEGDESVVDVLLENYLKSTRDASNLIDAIDQNTFVSPPASSKASTNPRGFNLNLQQINGSKGMQFCSPAVNSLDALLTSARGLLQSSRTARSHRGDSAESYVGSPTNLANAHVLNLDIDGEAAGACPKACLTRLSSKESRPSDAAASSVVDGAVVEDRRPHEYNTDHCSPEEATAHAHAQAQAVWAAQTGSAQEEAPAHAHAQAHAVWAAQTASAEASRATSKESSGQFIAPHNAGVVPDQEAANANPLMIGPDGVPATRSEILHKLSEMDDPEAMRNFMKQFLLGVRRRLLHMDGEAGEEEEDSDEDESSRDPSDDGNQSVWTFRSVNSFSPCPSDG